MALYLFLQIPLILQFFDISKFFDRESLRDGMNTIYKSGIQGKLYRLWYNLNKKTKEIFEAVRLGTAVVLLVL